MNDAKAGTGPRYAQLRNLLQARIESGEYKVGDLLPTELELCTAFALSRHTVREAIRQLTEAGLVRRRQGSGTQVVAARVEQHYVHSMRSLSELFQYATDTHFHIDSMGDLSPGEELGDLLGEGSRPWLFMEGIRLQADDRTPICFSRIYIADQFRAVADTLTSYQGAIYRLIEQRFGVTVADVEQQITAEPIDRGAARRLGVSAKLWAVRVVRRYLDADGQVLIASINYHPGDRFSYAMHLRREGTKGWS